jgi:formylglycine-generating enzyme required for sulfatase activity
VSARGAFDMVGNLDEWVADWVPLSTVCSSWGVLSDDFMCLFGASGVVGGPGALLRGGDYRSRSSAGPLAVVGSGGPSSSSGFIGFRCTRDALAPAGDPLHDRGGRSDARRRTWLAQPEAPRTR